MKNFKCGDCNYFAENVILPCAVNPSHFQKGEGNWFVVNQEACTEFTPNQDLPKKTVAKFSIRTLSNKKFSFEIWIYSESDYWEELDVEHYFDLRQFDSHKQIFQAIQHDIELALKQQLDLSELYNNDSSLEIYLQEDGYTGEINLCDQFYKDYLIILSYPEEYIWIDCRTNEMFKGSEIDDFNFPDHLTDKDVLDYIKDFLDEIEAERNKQFVPGQLSLL